MKPIPSAGPPALLALRVHDPPRVLVAEDDVEMCRLVVEALRKDGYDVQVASDGGQLHAAVSCESDDGGRADAVDLVVSDVRMPRGSGLEVLEALRAEGRAIPVILMTAFGDAATRARARSLGALLFDKPFDVNDLRAAVASLVGRDR